MLPLATIQLFAFVLQFVGDRSNVIADMVDMRNITGDVGLQP